MKQAIIIILLVLIAAGAAFAGDPQQPNKVPVVLAGPPAIDGAIGSKEYAASFTDPGTGIVVSWQADTANLYCALQSPGKGWLAIGFGSDGMSGADMAIAYTGADGTWIVEEQMGKSFFRHGKVDQPILLNGKAGLAGGKTVMEFAIPLALSNHKTISAAAALPFILAYHKDKTTFTKHTKRSSGAMVLAGAAGDKK
jgi:hypothetical protein